MQQETFATRLKILMKEHSVTQNELGNIVNASRQSISLYVNGDRTPDIEIAAKLADYFHVSVDYMLGREEIKSPKPIINDIHNYIGLSENAIDILHNHIYDSLILVLNDLIENREFYELCRTLSHIPDEVQDLKTDIEELKNKLDNIKENEFDDFTEYKETERALSIKENELEFRYWQFTKQIENLLKSFCEL